MNLMFWKKKKPDADEAADDDSGEESSSAGLRAEDADQDAPEPHEKGSGLKEWFSSVAQNLKTGHATETEGEPAGAEAAHGAKAEAPPHHPHGHDEADESAEDEAQEAGAGLAQRMKERFAAFAQRFRRPASQEDDAEEAGEEPPQAGKEHAEETEPEEESGEEIAVRRQRKRRRLLIAAASILSLLLLAGIGFVVRKVFLTHPVQQSVTSGTIETSREAPPQAAAPSATARPSEVDMLKKRNEELQQQLDALKNERSPEPASVAISYGTHVSAVSSTSQGDLALGTGDPKAAAQGLKEAIEAMNAATGDTRGAPRK